MPTISPFTPQVGSAGSIAVIASTSASLLQLPLGGGSQIRVVNTASIPTYMDFGASTVTASASTPVGIIMNAASTEIFTFDTIATGTVGNKTQYVSVLASAATTTLVIFTRGEGF